MRAFERARAEGARAIELDARVCVDGTCFVFHDETLARMTAAAAGGPDDRRADGLELGALRAVDLGGGARIPTLVEVLDWARAGDVAVNVELKHGTHQRAALVRGVLQDVRSSGADVLLSSFDPALLALAAAWGPAVPRALLTHLDQSFWATVVQRTVRAPIVAAVHIERTQAAAHDLGRYAARGLRLGAWTVNDASEARDLVRRGVATIITDRPGDMLVALKTVIRT
jgi:glycerophosphoryl diester phosphodiesterase